MSDYETNDLRARRGTWMLRPGKPARDFNGTFYRPGEPIDPDDPNVDDPALRKHLVPARASRPAPPAAPPVVAPEAVFSPAPPVYETDHLGDEDPDEDETGD